MTILLHIQKYSKYFENRKHSYYYLITITLHSFITLEFALFDYYNTLIVHYTYKAYLRL